MSVSQTTRLTAIFAGGMLIAMALSARYLGRAGEPIRLAAYGAVVGVFAFAAVIMAGAFDSLTLFAAGTLLIGIGNGLFAVGTLTAAMLLAGTATAGLVIGTWGAVQATALGCAVFLGGALGYDGSPDTGRHDQPAIVRPRDTLWRGLSPRNNYLIRLARCTGTIGAAARQ